MLLLIQKRTRAGGWGAETSAPSVPGSWEFIDGPWASPKQRRVLLLYELLAAQLGGGAAKRRPGADVQKLPSIAFPV